MLTLHDLGTIPVSVKTKVYTEDGSFVRKISFKKYRISSASFYCGRSKAQEVVK
jgi:hypothetical protein